MGYISQTDQTFLNKNSSFFLRPKPETNNNTYNNTVTLNRNVNGIGKLNKNLTETSRKRLAISNINKCNYLTPPKQIAAFLTDIFGVWERNPDHWLYIAEYYTPKSISSVINQMIKIHRNGYTRFNTPASYFTSLLKSYHKPRASHRKGVHKKHRDKLFQI